MPHATSDWAKAHATYSSSDFSHNEPTNELATLAAEWRARQENMQHGHLIRDNSFFESHRQGKMYMVHGTSNFEAILSSGVLYASAGCLVGAVYGAQVFPEDKNVFRIHNLGEYILHHEVPSILSAHKKIKQVNNLLLLEIDLPKNSNPLKAGVDYLRMGGIHYSLYSSLQYLLSSRERHDIERNVATMLQGSMGFLAYCHHLFQDGPQLSLAESRKFMARLNDASRELPMLGYLYFEAVSEYLMLNSTDPTTLRLAHRREFNNWLYKQLMYDIYSDLRGNFSIGRFNPSQEELIAYLDKAKKKGHVNIQSDDMLMYVASRVMFWVNTRFFSNPGKSINWLNTALTFNGFAERLAPLIGHCIHRQLREQDRYREFYFYFDHMKALEVWNYWNKAGIAIPFNGVFPKGEIGINPAFTNMSYKIYEANVCENDAQSLFATEELPIEIVPRLIELDKSFMRAGGHYSLQKQGERTYA